MADNYLERHRMEYEARKAAWLKKKRHIAVKREPPLKRDDEAL